jgi:hypothetical protein
MRPRAGIAIAAFALASRGRIAAGVDFGTGVLIGGIVVLLVWLLL